MSHTYAAAGEERVMNRILSAAILAVGLAGATLATAGVASAAGASVTLNLGDIAFGYNDGYWDHGHQWHQWQNKDDMQSYRTAQNNQFHDWKHSRDPDQGWTQ
jgi:hypothetical protein